MLSSTYIRAHSISTNKIYDFTKEFSGINLGGRYNRRKIIVNI